MDPKEVGAEFQINYLCSLVISVIKIRKMDYYREFTNSLQIYDNNVKKMIVLSFFSNYYALVWGQDRKRTSPFSMTNAVYNFS